jgi:hypothetical protein
VTETTSRAEMETFFIEVGFTTERPVIPDQLVTNVVIATDRGANDATLTAAQWVGSAVEMVTSTRIVRVEV